MLQNKKVQTKMFIKKKKSNKDKRKLFTPLTPSNMIHLVLKIQSSSFFKIYMGVLQHNFEMTIVIR